MPTKEEMERGGRAKEFMEHVRRVKGQQHKHTEEVVMPTKEAIEREGEEEFMEHMKRVKEQQQKTVEETVKQAVVPHDESIQASLISEHKQDTYVGDDDTVKSESDIQQQLKDSASTKNVKTSLEISANEAVEAQILEEQIAEVERIASLWEESDQDYHDSGTLLSEKMIEPAGEAIEYHENGYDPNYRYTN